MNGVVQSRHSTEEAAVGAAKRVYNKFDMPTVVEKIAWSELWAFTPKCCHLWETMPDGSKRCFQCDKTLSR